MVNQTQSIKAAVVMRPSIEQQAAADLASAKATSDAIMGPIFGALGVSGARELADPSLLRCIECGQPIHGKPFPGQTHRECFAALDGPYDEEEQ